MMEPRTPLLNSTGGAGAATQEKKVSKTTSSGVAPASALGKSPLARSWAVVQTNLDSEAFQQFLERRIFDVENPDRENREAFRAALRSHGPELLQQVGEAVTGAEPDLDVMIRQWRR